MKSFAIVLALVAYASADVSHLAQQTGEAGAQILRQDVDVLPDHFQFAFETSNGIAGQATGTLKQVAQDAEAIVVQGSNQYTAPDGQLIQTSYTADENGYQPQGAHLPTPPAPLPIPDYILRSLEYIRTHPPKPEGPNQKYQF